MKLKTIIPMLLMLTFIFSIGLISATVYQTPGYVSEPESVSPEVTVPTDVQEDSNKGIGTFWIFIIVITFMVLVFLVIKKRVFKKRKKIESNLNLSEIYEKEEKSFEEPKNETDKLQEEGDKKIEEESDEMMKEIGLDEVEETKDGKEDEY